LDYLGIFLEKRKGFYKQVNIPAYGSQDIGVTPGGVMDQFSFDCGNALLGNPADSPALEIILAPVLVVRENIYFAITGAPFVSPQMVTNSEKTMVHHGTVYFASAGAELLFGTRKSGLRSYLCYRKADRDTPDTTVTGRSLVNFKTINQWIDREGCIRVIEGPEYKYLVSPEDFFTIDWSVSLYTDEMGMRLESKKKFEVKNENIISEAVTNGTVQATPGGLIVLLKHRQTIGGYTRVFSVISADVDLLSQYMPQQVLRFKKVTVQEAWRIARQKRDKLLSIKKRFSYV
jgi:allophanate hydrolase subunit 2